MYSLTIVFGPRATQWTLMYETLTAAVLARSHLYGENENSNKTDPHCCDDDFGQSICIKPEDVVGILMEDLDKSKQVHVETALHQARTMAASEEAMRQEPAVREAQSRAQARARMGGGPAMISPRIG